MESDDVRQIVVEISCAENNAFVPKSLLDSRVPAQIAFGLESEIHSENLVLTTGRRKSGGCAGVRGGFGLADEIAGCFPPGPDVAELIEIIEAASANEN